MMASACLKGDGLGARDAASCHADRSSAYLTGMADSPVCAVIDAVGGSAFTGPSSSTIAFAAASWPSCRYAFARKSSG